MLVLWGVRGVMAFDFGGTLGVGSCLAAFFGFGAAGGGFCGFLVLDPVYVGVGGRVFVVGGVLMGSRKV